VAASFLAGRTVETALPILAEGDVPNFATGERAAGVLAALWRRGLASGSPRGFARISAGEDGGSEALPWPGTPLEPEAMDWLEAQGIRVVERAFVRTGDEAASAASRLGYPVVLKIVSDRILHKTDAGGVALDLRGENDVRASFDRLAQIEGSHGFRGVLVSRMVERPIEAIVGLTRDPHFGPVVGVGLGGIHTEVLADLSLRVAPIGEAEALAMIDGLRGAPILRGGRGNGPLDVDALAALVAKVSELGVRFPEIAELDLNPVFLFEDGCATADARLIGGRRPEKGEDSDA
jgi:acyl-CoA synthetase (NDP forming)